MKFFIDTADIEEIREINAIGILDGVTTNPSLVSKVSHRGSFDEIMTAICKEVKGPVSVEVLGQQADAMIDEAKQLRRFGDNVTVKIPMTLEGLKAVRRCAQEGIPTNVTLIFSPSQALLAAKAGATYLSPFIGRLDDISHPGMELIQDISTILFNYDFETEIIVASVRHPLHVVEAALIGADIVTIPYDVIVKLANHPLTDIGIRRFFEDWQKVKKQRSGSAL
jgi:transaldolase